MTRNDNPKAQSIDLTPSLALAAGLIYMGSADGRFEEDEQRHVARIVPVREVLLLAAEFVQCTDFESYLQQASRILNRAQRMCLLLNAADLALVDHKLTGEEREMLETMAKCFEISSATWQPYLRALEAKNTISVFPDLSRVSP